MMPLPSPPAIVAGGLSLCGVLVPDAVSEWGGSSFRCSVNVKYQAFSGFPYENRKTSHPIALYSFSQLQLWTLAVRVGVAVRQGIGGV